MGWVYKPEDAEKKSRRIPDIRPEPPPSPENLLQEVQLLRREVERIKQALRRHGIRVE